LTSTKPSGLNRSSRQGWHLRSRSESRNAGRSPQPQPILPGSAQPVQGDRLTVRSRCPSASRPSGKPQTGIAGQPLLDDLASMASCRLAKVLPPSGSAWRSGACRREAVICPHRAKRHSSLPCCIGHLHSLGGSFALAFQRRDGLSVARLGQVAIWRTCRYFASCAKSAPTSCAAAAVSASTCAWLMRAGDRRGFADASPVVVLWGDAARSS
jgi:hypothetical protein